jgi:hypothetical protein
MGWNDPSLSLRSKVVHSGRRLHARVTIPLEFQIFAGSVKKFLHDIIWLQNCLKNRQTDKPPLKQGKSRTSEMFYADLSTETVDSFALATPGAS